MGESHIENYVPGPHDQGGCAQMRYQRHIKDHMNKHHKEVAEQLTELFDSGKWKRVVLIGQDRIIANFKAFLPERVRQQIADTFSMDFSEDRSTVLRQVSECLLQRERDEISRQIQELKERAPQNGLATFGLGPIELVMELNRIGGAHGVGRIDLVESRLVGMKSRGAYETPGGTLLLVAHRELEALTLDRTTLHYKDLLAGKYAELVYNGQWFTPLREAMDTFVDSTQGRVTGAVRLKLYKGNVIVAGRKSPYSLYREDLATFGEDAVYNQRGMRKGLSICSGCRARSRGFLIWRPCARPTTAGAVTGDEGGACDAEYSTAGGSLVSRLYRGCMRTVQGQSSRSWSESGHGGANTPGAQQRAG